MVNETNFIVRKSGTKENSYYIDYCGAYKVADIAKVAGVKTGVIREKYLAHGARYDQNLDVYYFESADSAKKVIAEILDGMKSDCKGKLIFLTEAEIEYIRRALVNEGVNIIHVKNEIKDAIFKKLNA